MVGVEPNIELLERIIASTFEELTPAEVRIEAQQAFRYLTRAGDSEDPSEFLTDFLSARETMLRDLLDR